MISWTYEKVLNFKTFLISALPFDNVHLAGVDGWNLPFLLANGFKLYPGPDQIAG